MAEQTELQRPPPCVFSLFRSVINICDYVLCVLKLYFIGAVALLMQLFEKPIPVKGLPSQTGRVAIVTGGALGIGFHTCKQLASLGAQVIIASRSEEEAERAIEAIRKECPAAKVMHMELNLASFKSVRQFVAEFLSKDLPLHILINNAGVMLVPFVETEDGYETHLQVNHLSHALLTCLLKEKLEGCAGNGRAGRVVNLSSVVHHVASFNSNTFAERQSDDWTYSPHNAYCVSKLAILLYTYALSRQWSKDWSRITVNAVHPGVVNTALYQHVHWSIAWALNAIRWLLFMNPEKAAISVIHTATSPDLEGISGCYFYNCQNIGSSTLSKLPTLQQDVYARTQEVVQKKVM